MLKRLHSAAGAHDMVVQTLIKVSGWSRLSAMFMKFETEHSRSSALTAIDNAGIPISFGVRIVFWYSDFGMWTQSLCVEYAVVFNVTLPSWISTSGTNFATTYSPFVHGGRLAFWTSMAVAESSGRRKSGYIGNALNTFELNAVLKDNGNVTFETNEAVVNRNEVKGMTKKFNNRERNMHVVSSECLFRSATTQL